MIMNKSMLLFGHSIHCIMWYITDEETDGEYGMAGWVETDHFKSINLGLALDEGLASENETFVVFYGERECCGE